MTDPARPPVLLEGLIATWRTRAASNGAIYAQGLDECADELDAALRRPGGLPSQTVVQDLERALAGFRSRPSGEPIHMYAAGPVNGLIDAIELALQHITERPGGLPNEPVDDAELPSAEDVFGILTPDAAGEAPTPEALLIAEFIIALMPDRSRLDLTRAYAAIDRYRDTILEGRPSGEPT